MKKLSILVIEDDAATAALLVAALQDEGHMVSTARTMEEGCGVLERSNVDLMIMDRGLPDGDGIKLCLTLRRDSRYRAIPILMLTGRAESGDRVLGLRFGADDYLGKPFEMEELLARVDALVRRAQPTLAGGPNRLACGGVLLDIPGRQVIANGEVVPLSGMEYELLRILMERAGTALSREFILKAVWKSGDKNVGTKTVDVTIMGLRRKLGGLGSLIKAVRSYGYKISDGKNTP